MKGDGVVAEEWKFVGGQEFCSCLGAPWHLQICTWIDCLFFPLADNLYLFVHYIYLLIHLWV